MIPSYDTLRVCFFNLEGLHELMYLDMSLPSSVILVETAGKSRLILKPVVALPAFIVAQTALFYGGVIAVGSVDDSVVDS
jgi:hypothetical protein